ncbi:MAG: ATP-binding protein [Candidatus Dependentiae bacterium]
MFIKRQIQGTLLKYAQGYPAIAILGPRQSGKTTLAKEIFKNHLYISLENINQRTFAQDDPEKFLRTNENEYGLILDEIQQVPELLSYIQTHIDTYDRPGYFILTGSQNFILHQSISQTLAGRIAITTLLPLSIEELKNASLLPNSPEALILKGFYPRIYAKDLEPEPWYIHYTTTYIERDVRQIVNVNDLSTFERFLQLCAGRIGQLVNFSSLASDAGISHNTARSWLSILQASYIIFLLQPHHKNFNKRLVKSPKLYFYDTGLACSLLGISEEKQLKTHYMVGGLFESLVISDIFKNIYNAGKKPKVYFWRDSHGHEVDCIIERGTELIPIEIKSGETITKNFFNGLYKWNNLSDTDPEKNYLIYGGTENQIRSKGKVLNWKSIANLDI